MPDNSADTTENALRVPPWRVLENELTALDLEAPLTDDNCADSTGFEQLYTAAAKTASGPQAAVYGLLGVICSFHFRPARRFDPPSAAEVENRHLPIPLPHRKRGFGGSTIGGFLGDLRSAY